MRRWTVTRWVGVSALALALGVGCSDDPSGQGVNSTSGVKNNTSGADMGGSSAGGDLGGSTNGAGDMSAPSDMSAAGDMGAPSDMSAAGDMDALDLSTGFDLADLPFEVNEMGQILCGDHVCACADGVDNDGDGLRDGFDPECTGPFDDDEATFGTGIPGDNRDPVWQDCFFDGNSGAGDDKCRYHADCLTGALPQTDSKCAVSDACRDNCQKYAPNGCDCFGCCEVFRPDGTSKHVQIGGSCAVAQLDDEAACPSCVPTTACADPCGECELCLGKTVDDLPASCFPTTTPDMGTSTGDMGTSTGDMGASTGDMGASTGDMGATTGDMGATTGDMGTSTGDMGTPPGEVCSNGQPVCAFTGYCDDPAQYCWQGCCIIIEL